MLCISHMYLSAELDLFADKSQTFAILYYSSWIHTGYDEWPWCFAVSSLQLRLLVATGATVWQFEPTPDSGGKFPRSREAFF